MNKTILRLSRSARSPMPVLRALRIFGALVGLAAISTQVFSATNDLTSALQKGLFEEEVNRNADAAIAVYQSLVAQVDRDRQVAATAIFRLGECYRKLGRTNEAVIQYERIVRDFSDQQTLVTLSGQNLVALKAAPARSSVASSTDRTTVDRDVRYNVLKLQLDQIAAVDPEHNDPLFKARAINRAFEDPRLQEALERERRLQSQQTDATTSAELRRARAERNTIAEEILAAKQKELESLRMPVRQLRDANVEDLVRDIDDVHQIQLVEEMIKNSPDLINGSASQNPLIAAAGRGSVRVAAYLLDHGADINREVDGQTALIAATLSGQIPMIELLASRGADLNAKDNGGYTALHHAVRSGFRAVTETLLAHRPDLNVVNWPVNGQATPLHIAVGKRNAPIAGLLVAKGANVNATNLFGATPLHVAAGSNSVEIVRLLLDAKANVSAKDNDGNTPLHEAALSNQPEIIEELLKRGAAVDARNFYDATPLFLANYKMGTKSVKLLLERKANPNLSGKFGNLERTSNPNDIEHLRARPLFFALHRDNEEVLKLLLEHGADPEQLDHPAYPDALGLAIARNYTRGVELLLQHKADFNRKTPSEGGTPLHYAATVGFIEGTKLLVGAGAKVNAQDNFGNTPLHKVVSRHREVLLYFPASTENDRSVRQKSVNNCFEVAAFLLDHKANPNVQNQAGDTPLDWVSQPMQGDIMMMPTPGRRYNSPPGAVRTDTSQTSPTDAEARTKLASLLIDHGALANLPKPDRIQVRRPATGLAVMIFSKSTNNWNQFTLFDTLVNLFRMPFFMVPHVIDDGSGRVDPRKAFTFSDLTRVAIVHHGSGTNVTRKEINLFNGPNQIDCSKDVPLDFGDVVEIPERLHALDQTSEGITDEEWKALVACFDSWNIKLLAGKREATCRIFPRPDTSMIGNVLGSSDARKILFSSSDLSRVKVTRQDPATAKTREWILDCSNPTQLPDFWLRNGDVVEVPEKQ